MLVPTLPMNGSYCWLPSKSEGLPILYEDYSYKSDAELLELLNQATEFHLHQEIASFKRLVNGTEIETSRKFLDLAKVYTNKSKDRYTSVAIFGLNPVQIPVISSIQRFAGVKLTHFDTYMEAFHFLMLDKS